MNHRGKENRTRKALFCARESKDGVCTHADLQEGHRDHRAAGSQVVEELAVAGLGDDLRARKTT